MLYSEPKAYYALLPMFLCFCFLNGYYVHLYIYYDCICVVDVCLCVCVCVRASVSMCKKNLKVDITNSLILLHESLRQVLIIEPRAHIW